MRSALVTTGVVMILIFWGGVVSCVDELFERVGELEKTAGSIRINLGSAP